MSQLALACLRLFHFLYSIFLVAWSLHDRWCRPGPKPLTVSRSQIPRNLAVVLVCSDDKANNGAVQEAFIQCVERITAWCKAVGVNHLTVFDRHGILVGMSSTVRQRLNAVERDSPPERSEYTYDFPPTPPSSDDSDCQFSGDRPSYSSNNVVTVYPESDMPRKSGRGKSGARRRGPRRGSIPLRPPYVQLACSASGKRSIVSVANGLLRAQQHNVEPGQDSEKFHISVNDLQYILEGEVGLKAPDLMIVHHVTYPKYQRSPVELHAFPPWQIRLSEIFHDASQWSLRSQLLRDSVGIGFSHSVITEARFCDALDEYSKAEFRVGK